MAQTLTQDDLDAIVAAISSGKPSVTLADAVTHGGPTAKMRLGSSTSTPAFYATNSGGTAIKGESTGGDGRGLDLLGEGAGQGLYAEGGATDATGILGQGGGFSGNGLSGVGAGTSAVLSNAGIAGIGGYAGPGLGLIGDGPGAGAQVQGGATSGNSLELFGSGVNPSSWHGQHDGLVCIAGPNGIGMRVLADNNADTNNRQGILVKGAGTGEAMALRGGTNADGLSIAGGNTAGRGLVIVAGGDGDGITVYAAGTGRHGINCAGGTDGDGLHLAGSGAGHDLVLAGSGDLVGRLAADALDNVLVDGKTLPAALQIIGALTAGIVSGAGTATETFLGLDGITTRAVMTVDAAGNRAAASYP